MIKCTTDYFYQLSQLESGIRPDCVENMKCEKCEQRDECEVYKREQEISSEIRADQKDDR